MSIQLNAISKTFATQTLFEDVTLRIGETSRVGLVGRNGCGKSTLLKIIMNSMQPDKGSIYRAPGVRINYLSQEPRITPEFTLEEEMQSVYADVNGLLEKEATILAELSNPDADTDAIMAIAETLHTVQEELLRLDAYNLESKIAKILGGLGFTEEDYQRKSGDFSGGWQMRINLAKVLLEGADILLLDEPTNHLDLEACEWLEDFLKNYPGGLMLVSHDRRFLDQVATEMAEFELGKMTVWPGNYTKTLELKQAALDEQAAAASRQQKELAKQEAFVDRFRASATRSTQAKSREKQLAKIERIEAPVTDTRRMTIRFPAPEPSGREVLVIKEMSKGFPGNPLFKKASATLERGHRVFILGANGTGKTTLLRMILGLEPADTGTVELGYKALLGYFSQNQLDTLDAKASAFDSIQKACPDLDNTEIRGLLGRFLFKGDQVFKPVSVLSGGEKSKVALAKLMMTGPNTLLLDEPTNHMDIPSKDVMTEAFLDYEGSIICISHDRYFIQQLATDIWEIYEGQLLTYGGNYDYYLFKRDEMHKQAREFAAYQAEQEAKKAAKKSVQPSANGTQAADSDNASASTGGKDSPLQVRRQIEKRVKKLEKEVGLLEQEVLDLQKALEQPDLQNDYQKLQTITEALETCQKSLQQASDAWVHAAEELEHFDREHAIEA